MGKTTTLAAIMGIVRAEAGTIRFGGEPIQHLPPYRIARLGLGLVPEGRQIFPNLSARENLLATAIPGRWSLDSVLDLFPGLRERQGHLGGFLSGGEQQMLAIGRALMTNPRLLLLDEATEGLAPRVRDEIWRVLARLKESGQAILVVDKNIAPLLRLADRHYILEKGRTVWSGSSAELAGAVELQHRYLGV
jgi:branched-chain amino acid transport system ATP-binding protein